MESHADLDSSQSLSIGSLHEEQQSDYYNLWNFFGLLLMSLQKN